MNWAALILSLRVTAVATTLIFTVGLALALLFARRQFRGKTFAETLVNLPLVLPPTVVGYYLLLVLGRGGPLVAWLDVHLLFTWGAAVIASAIVGLPLMVGAARASIAEVDPALENAARTLGSSEPEVLWRVTLPLARRGILAGLVLGATRALGRVRRDTDDRRQHPRPHPDAAAGDLRRGAKPPIRSGQRHGGADDCVGVPQPVGRAEVRESSAHHGQEMSWMPESPGATPASAPRLVIDIERQLPEFRLTVRLQVGTEICVLFGPSGVGKTTTLNTIAGLVVPDAGEIILDGRPLYRRGRPGAACNVPARRRNIGYVFQGYALFPHLTALENVAYPLRRQRDARSRAAVLLERMHLAHLADRYPAEISGGQQQRVAIARALAADPQVLLLDEPFSALDAGVREKLQRDLAALQAELHLVVIYVTHQLEDAFAMGHTLAVLGEGRVVQVGPIEEVFRRPVNAGVAEIMGMRNLFRAKVISAGPEGLTLDWDGLRLEAPPQAAMADAILTSYIRPEEIKVLYPDRPLTGAVAHNQVAGRIVESRPSTTYRVLRVALENGHDLEVRFPRHAYAGLSLREGETVSLSLRREALIGLEKT